MLSVRVFLVGLALASCGGSPGKAVPAEVEIEWPSEASTTSPDTQKTTNDVESPSCTKTASHIVKLIEDDFRENRELEKLAEEFLPELKGSLVQACGDDTWPLSARRCVVGASRVVQIYECEPVELPESVTKSSN